MFKLEINIYKNGGHSPVGTITNLDNKCVDLATHAVIAINISITTNYDQTFRYNYI